MHKIQIETNKTAGKINRNIYGHFSEHLGRCIYGGFYVDENGPVPNKNGLRLDVAEALKKIKIPVLRWPGGCFADEYHWMDGIGPKQNRPSIVNTHWGGVVEDNSFGTHEFMQLCELLECEPYICGNMGSGTVQEMSQWIEYITFGGVSPMASLRSQNGRIEPWHLKYFGVGNENWGCGGNMTPEYYAGEYRRYQTYCRNYGENKLYKIACGPNSGDYEWTETFMQKTTQAGKHLMDAISLHYYTVPGEKWANKGPATGFSEKEWFITLKKTLHMNELIEKHSAIMDKYDPDKKVALIVDEWGTWYDVEPGTNPGFLYQQNSLRDALVAALNFHIFHDHSERVQMANIAQTVNVLQAVILTEGEKMVTTPTYHVFDMFSGHQDADSLEITYDRGICEMDGDSIPAISASASKKDGKVLLSLVNLSHENPASAKVELGGGAFSLLEAKILHSDKLDEYNTFDSPENIVPVAFGGVAKNGGAFDLTLPPASVMTLQFEEKA